MKCWLFYTTFIYFSSAQTTARGKIHTTRNSLTFQTVRDRTPHCWPLKFYHSHEIYYFYHFSLMYLKRIDLWWQNYSHSSNVIVPPSSHASWTNSVSRLRAAIVVATQEAAHCKIQVYLRGHFFGVLKLAFSTGPMYTEHLIKAVCWNQYQIKIIIYVGATGFIWITL